MREVLFAFAAASALGACASTGPATQATNVDVSGYWRAVSHGQVFFCDKEQRGHFLQDVCYTRAQLKDRLLAENRFAGLDRTGPPNYAGIMSPYTSYTASGH